jgi:hypothetical protein
VLDQCLAAGPLDTVGARFEAAWKPEADAISWIGGQVRYQSPWMFVRTIIASAFGVNIASQAAPTPRCNVRPAAWDRSGPKPVRGAGRDAMTWALFDHPVVRNCCARRAAADVRAAGLKGRQPTSGS